MGETMVDFRENITEQLQAYAPYIRGNPLASLIAVKGSPGLAELAGDPPFSGADGLALDKAFGRLGWGFGSHDTRIWFGIVLSRPNHPRLSAQELRLICEIVDPHVIAALDDIARLALIEAFCPVEKSLQADFVSGGEYRVLGRHLVSIEGFEASLADEASKQKAWAQLKRCVFPSLR